MLVFFDFRYIDEVGFKAFIQQIIFTLCLVFASVGATADNGGESPIPFFFTGYPLAAVVSTRKRERSGCRVKYPSVDNVTNQL